MLLHFSDANTPSGTGHKTNSCLGKMTVDECPAANNLWIGSEIGALQLPFYTPMNYLRAPQPGSDGPSWRSHAQRGHVCRRCTIMRHHTSRSLICDGPVAGATL